MKIAENYCTKNNRYKAAEIFKPTGVVLHSIGTPQPKASALVTYWQNNPDTYAAHYVLDDTVIYNTIPENYRCYHVGSPGNSKYIGIERSGRIMRLRPKGCPKRTMLTRSIYGTVWLWAMI